MDTKQSPLTILGLAKELGVPDYTIRRLYSNGILPEPPRAGTYRLIYPDDVPKIRECLVKAGHLPA